MTKLVVSDRSWHYRILCLPSRIVGQELESDPKTLCGYFWSVVLTALATPFFLVGWVLIRHLIGTPILWLVSKGDVVVAVVVTTSATAAVTTLLWLNWSRTLIVAGIAVGCFIGFVLLCVGIGLIVEAHHDRRKPKPPKVETTKTRRLFWETLKAKKQRVCPPLKVHHS